MTILRPLLLSVLSGAIFAPLAQATIRFEVASVKPNRTARCNGPWDFRATRRTVRAENAPLLRIISRACQMTDDRVSGPAWLNSECYDINAKAPSGASDADLMPMLRTLLEERFHLVALLESGERPIFGLYPDKDGSKLRPYGNGVAVPLLAGDGRILFMARHMPDLC